MLSCCHVVIQYCVDGLSLPFLRGDYVRDELPNYVTDYTFDPSFCTVLYRLSFDCVFICVQYLVLATNGHTTPAPRNTP